MCLAKIDLMLNHSKLSRRRIGGIDILCGEGAAEPE